jgi:siroheme synthase
MTQLCVYIVGAGPGDPSLISVRGRRVLENADVVVYDHQVARALLRAAPAGAEKIDVGPAAPRTLDQEAISILLAEKIRDG